MSPSPKQRCNQCVKSKQRCEMPTNEPGSHCKRCIEKNLPCHGYAWPPVRNPGQNAEQDSNPAQSQNPSHLEVGARSSSNDVQFARTDSGYQVQSAYGPLAQQDPVSVGYSGYNNTETGFDPSFVNLMPQSTGWPDTQQYMPYQLGQDNEWYLSGQQNQRGDQPGQFKPY